MPWHVSKTDECPASKPWGVISDKSGKVACHESKESALGHVAKLYQLVKEGKIDASAGPSSVDDIDESLWPAFKALAGEA